MLTRRQKHSLHRIAAGLSCGVLLAAFLIFTNISNAAETIPVQFADILEGATAYKDDADEGTFVTLPVEELMETMFSAEMETYSPSSGFQTTPPDADAAVPSAFPDMNSAGAVQPDITSDTTSPPPETSGNSRTSEQQLLILDDPVEYTIRTTNGTSAAASPAPATQQTARTTITTTAADSPLPENSVLEITTAPTAAQSVSGSYATYITTAQAAPASSRSTGRTSSQPTSAPAATYLTSADTEKTSVRTTASTAASSSPASVSYITVTEPITSAAPTVTTTTLPRTTTAPRTATATATTTVTTAATTSVSAAAASEATTSKTAFTNVGGGIPNTDTDVYLKMLSLVNSARKQAGLNELWYSSRVHEVSELRVIELSSYYSHTRPNGTKFSTAFKELGIDYLVCGENIAYGKNMFKTPEEVFEAWMNSPSHKENILNPDFECVGFGLSILKVRNDTYYYWAQEFATFDR